MSRGEALISYQLTVNGEIHELSNPPQKTLLEVLREDLELTGTKFNCEQGECGACTVLIDDETVNSCIVLAASVTGQTIITIEGLSRNSGLHPLQEAFLEYDAAQCGYCTPGMLLAAHGYIAGGPEPSRSGIIRALEGNYCRCTGYEFIVDAVQHVLDGLASGRGAEE